MILEAWIARLEGWHDFYVFAGTAAATLMGLMFVVVSLGQRTLSRAEGQPAIPAFFTPIVAFFATAMLLSLVMLIPPLGPHALGVLLMALGVAGIIYMLATGAHAVWRESELALDDLAWYVVLPYASFLGIAAAGIFSWRGSGTGLYIVGAVSALLLLTGIRNAWDLVVYMLARGEG